MEETECLVSKGRRACSAAHWLLLAAVAISAAFLAAAVVETMGSVSRYGIPTGADADRLMSIVAIIAVVVLMDCVVRRIRAGVPPFAEENAGAFLLMAAVVLMKAVLSVIVQAAIFFADTGFGKSFLFPIDAIMAGGVFLVLYMIFKYGSTLQAEVQDLV
ncbi:MAG: hypothetical protein J5674_02965 [Candidatus Methanomethylophilaceae archaeon]|nr:hypothetical protein [Candidatus Methanomethylophilaceae archaeon]